jgi:hypothetical protein
MFEDLLEHVLDEIGTFEMEVAKPRPDARVISQKRSVLLISEQWFHRNWHE